MKIFKNQSGIAPLAIVLLAGITGIISFTGYRVYDMNQQKSQESYQAPKKAEKKEVPEPPKFEIPEGFVEYKNKELGLSFAYPKEWGTLERTSHTDSAIFYAGFSATKIKDEGSSHLGDYDIALYGNNGKQSFTTGFGRGGALWDDAGFLKANNKYFSRSIFVLDGKRKENKFEISNPTLIKGLNTEVIITQIEFFGTPTTEMLINLNREYYGAKLVVNPDNKERVKQLNEVAKTIKVF